MGDREIYIIVKSNSSVAAVAFSTTVDLLKLMPLIVSEVFEVCFTKIFIESVID